MEISVLLPAYNEEKNVATLIGKIRGVLNQISKSYEIIVVDGNSKDNTREEAKKAGARVMVQKGRGYGNALKEGFEEAKGNYIVTMDADLSHDPEYIKDLWKEKDNFDIVIASRYVKGGGMEMPLNRILLSKFLNAFFARALSTPVKDLSSGYRMYNKKIFRDMKIVGSDFNVLQEILVRAYSDGWSVKEIPFHFKPRGEGESKLKLSKFAVSYMKTLKGLWMIRNSIESADYDSRAYNSIIPIQKYWQRKRFKIITGQVDKTKKILDVGCGTNRIIQELPQAVASDINFKRVNYLKKTNKYRVNSDINHMPFKDETFDTVICSQVIEHIPKEESVFKELNRVLKKGGLLIIGTPDYDKRTWRVIEKVYKKILKNAYGDKHITNYGRDMLDRILKQHGFEIINHKYIMNAELIIKAKKNEI